MVGSGWGKVELRRYKMGLEWGWRVYLSLEKAGVKGLEAGVTLQSGGCCGISRDLVWHRASESGQADAFQTNA